MFEPSQIWEAIKNILPNNNIKLSEDINKNVKAVNFEDFLVLEVLDKDSYLELKTLKEKIEKLATNQFKPLIQKNICIDLVKLYEDENKVEIIKQEDLFDSNLNPEYRLDNYIVGDNNMHAYGLATSIANVEGADYSPLLIYGDSGLGKTHLAQAIGNEYTIEHKKKVKYMTANTFTNEWLATYINYGNNSQNNPFNFRKQFQDLDMLIIDDVQFFETVFGRGEDKTQKEFYEVFNMLYEKGKPIILISDKYPDKFQNADERLRTRFRGGTSAELRLPDKSVRMSMIKNYAEKNELEISDELIAYISDELETNFREILGVMKTLKSKVQFFEKKIDKDLIEEELNKREKKKKEEITKEKVMDEVCRYYNINKEEILSKKRTSDVVKPRDAFRFILAKGLNMEIGKIGKILNTDHSAVSKAIKKVEETTDKELKTDIAQIRTRLGI